MECKVRRLLIKCMRIFLVRADSRMVIQCPAGDSGNAETPQKAKCLERKSTAPLKGRGKLKRPGWQHSAFNQFFLQQIHKLVHNSGKDSDDQERQHDKSKVEHLETVNDHIAKTL
jgi:hypothetical protein